MGTKSRRDFGILFNFVALCNKVGVDVFVGNDELATRTANSDGQESSTVFEMAGCRIYASSQFHECTNGIRMVPVEEADSDA